MVIYSSKLKNMCDTNSSMLKHSAHTTLWFLLTTYLFANSALVDNLLSIKRQQNTYIMDGAFVRYKMRRAFNFPSFVLVYASTQSTNSV